MNFFPCLLCSSKFIFAAFTQFIGKIPIFICARFCRKMVLIQEI